MGTETMATANIALARLWPSMVTTTMASSKAGKARSMSMARISPLSVRPPRKPDNGADEPCPTTIGTETVTNPTASEMREPCTSRLNSSRTLPSRPNQCSGWSAGQPSMWMHGGRRGLRALLDSRSGIGSGRCVGDDVGEYGDGTPGSHQDQTDNGRTLARGCGAAWRGAPPIAARPRSTLLLEPRPRRRAVGRRMAGDPGLAHATRTRGSRKP